MKTLPDTLKRSPLVEAVFEARFKPTGASLATKLQNAFFAQLGKEYSKVEALPIGALAAEIRENDPNLRYLAQYRISAKNASIFLGDRVAGVGEIAPYSGWNAFRQKAKNFLLVLKSSNGVAEFERVSMKFVNILPAMNGQQLSLLDIRVVTPMGATSESGFQLRMENNDDRFMRIIQISTNAEGKAPDGIVRKGLFFTIDIVSSPATSQIWGKEDEMLDSLHSEAKSMFFDFLRPDTLASLEPGKR